MAGGDKHPGMMGDGTEEQNLDQPGNPGARISKEDVEKAFGGDAPGAETDDAGVTDKAKDTSTDTMPKDNSHNFG